MKCKCGGHLITIDSRERGYTQYRRKVCRTCGKRVSTKEIPAKVYKRLKRMLEKIEELTDFLVD
jgi:hypothetical protein